MKVAVFSVHNFERDYLIKSNAGRHELILLPTPLSESTVALARGCDAVSIFTADNAKAGVLTELSRMGINYVAIRAAGYNQVDLKKAKELNIKVARVPAYSPYAIAEHTIALILALNRKLMRAHQRVMDLNFSLDGLVGFDMNGKTVGVIGTGKIGTVFIQILRGFGCKVLAYDEFKNPIVEQMAGVSYTDFDSLCKQSDIISLHVPLNDGTRYMINSKTIALMKPGVMLINTSRGALIKTKDVIEGLKSRHIGSLGIDVYEEEEGLFFYDHSDADILEDDTISRLMTFKNVLITAHQAFLTETALTNIADTTVSNLDYFSRRESSPNEISA
ncbi:2-hydroxyacid dehydrogenase [Chryseolinea sp. T2]|uniref:2-hydroxyacid dehydrogenase n=1 Tax=Chryseolinea sp. T2 TaxID=3129255 RepID=UPI0030778353